MVPNRYSRARSARSLLSSLRPFVCTPLISPKPGPKLSTASHAVASASTASIPTPSPLPSSSLRRRYHISALANPNGKGKGRALEPRDDSFACAPRTSGGLSGLTRREIRALSRMIGSPVFSATPGYHLRAFHTTSRRDALPLIPAGLAFLKSTSILTVITALSRVLISFFPIGTIAALRMRAAKTWIDSDLQRPKAGPEAEEFWKMWCEGERGVNVTKDDAKKLLEGQYNADDKSLQDGDGRTAFVTPIPPGRPGRHATETYLDPAKLKKEETSEFRQTMFIRRTRFFFPPLPPASVPYYDRLSPEIRGEVDALRRYWIGVRMFKDRLALSRVFFFVIFVLPCLLLLGVYAAALERTPLTGRWRIILLTPEEEDKVSSSLAGVNWYKSVINLLTTPEAPAPPIVPASDWRWRWVEGVLRKLEAGVLTANLDDPKSSPPGAEGILQPPFPKYPLKPRPRVSTMLHCALPGGTPLSGQEHLEIGPPYSLMLMHKDDKNAFSYGFGGKGAGGIVVYTGLLDDVLRNGLPSTSDPPEPGSRTQSFFDLFGGLFTSSARPSKVPPHPTEEQTLQLACVLAHEMGHLLLSHHLETLSQQQVLWPSLLGLSMDLIRAFIWPFTVFLGPTVNDALANMGRASTEELSDKYGEIGFQWKHEYEADLAGLRILARAGFDPYLAVDHFADSVASLHEIQPLGKDTSEGFTSALFKLWTRATHPAPEKRVAAIRAELARWEREKEAAGTD